MLKVGIICAGDRELRIPQHTVGLKTSTLTLNIHLK